MSDSATPHYLVFATNRRNGFTGAYVKSQGSSVEREFWREKRATSKNLVEALRSAADGLERLGSVEAYVDEATADLMRRYEIA